ncbi:hypothetical protein L195_g062482, partial [Trifolium pratense]
MKEVWLGSFKLRINKSRFDRNEEERKTKEMGRQKDVEYNGNGSHSGRSFKTALVHSSSKQVVAEKSSE